MTEGWIQELRDELDVEGDFDADRLLDVARLAAHQVERKVAPITTYLMGIAVGRGDLGSFDQVAAAVEELLAHRTSEGSS